MALDTAEKRRSASIVSLYPLGPGVTPNSDKDQEWRQEAGYGYSGILAETVEAAEPEIIELAGSYDPIVALTGSYESIIALTGDHTTIIALTGSVDMAASANFQLYQGEDKHLDILISGEEVSDWDAQILISPGTESTYLVEDTLSLKSGTTDTLRYTFARATTVSATPKDYTFEVRRTDTGSNTVLLTGTMKLLKSK